MSDFAYLVDELGFGGVKVQGGRPWWKDKYAGVLSAIPTPLVAILSAQSFHFDPMSVASKCDRVYPIGK